MSGAALREILAQELAAAGIAAPGDRKPLGAIRITRWSKKQPGFGTRTYRSGKRVYIVQTRMHGVVRTTTICNAAYITESAAMDIARRILLRAQVGENPADERKRVRAVPPFDRFLSRYWERAEPSWKASTKRTHGIYRRKHLDGSFGSKSIDAITEADVLNWYVKVADNAGPGAANRALDILRAIFNAAEVWGQCSPGSNPCRGIRRYRGRRLERHLTHAEMNRLGRVIEAHRQDEPVHVAALTMLLLTGCRYSEIVGLTWREVSGSRLKLEDSKTGARTVWLGAQARGILERFSRGQNDELVFGDRTTGKRIQLSSYWLRTRAEAGLPRVRIHDLRHSFASRAAAMSETLPMIGKLLGHRSIQSTARYSHLDDTDVAEAAQRIGDLIESMIAR